MSIFKWGVGSYQKTMLAFALVAFLIAAVAGCSSRGDMQDRSERASAVDDAMGATLSVDGLTISNAIASEAPLAGGNGAVYLTIHSESADQIISAASPSAAVVEFHESLDDNGIMRMEPKPDGFALPAGDDVVLEQGGKHMMLMNLADALEAGDEIEITLNFRDHAPVTLTVPVLAISEMHKHK